MARQRQGVAMQMRRWMKGGAVALAVAAVAAGWLASQGPGGLANLASVASSGWDMIRADAPATPSDSAPSTANVLSAEQVRVKLFKEGSFQGTEPSGNWCVATGKLTACPELRKRFEYYILGLGEVTIADVRVLVDDEARRAHGDALANAIMGIWDKYWQLRTYTPRNAFVQSDQSTWRPAFEEQRMVRRQVLGDDWAMAFYADEEAKFKQFVAQIESGQPPAPDPGEPVPQMAPGKDPAAVHAERVARYGQAAADRLAKADEEWADWERRLAGARSEWERLKTSPQLSDLQRQQDMEAYIRGNFKPDEHLRVRALLQL
jgi:lipase chaperone LimK